MAYLSGMSRSCDAVDAHWRRNPKGRASFPASLRCSGSTDRQGPSSPSRLGVRENTLRRGYVSLVLGALSLLRGIAVLAGGGGLAEPAAIGAVPAIQIETPLLDSPV